MREITDDFLRVLIIVLKVSPSVSSLHLRLVNYKYKKAHYGDSFTLQSLCFFFHFTDICGLWQIDYNFSHPLGEAVRGGLSNGNL